MIKIPQSHSKYFTKDGKIDPVLIPMLKKTEKNEFIAQGWKDLNWNVDTETYEIFEIYNDVPWETLLLEARPETIEKTIREWNEDQKWVVLERLQT